MPPSKKKLLKIILNCGSPKPSEVYDPKPMPKPKPNTNCNNVDDHEEQQEYLTSTITTTATATTTSSTAADLWPEPDHYRVRPGASRIANSVAVVKDSDDPCKDFKDSMMQMVVERRLCSRDDLEELLDCFLELNSPCHRRLIVHAFTEIWNEVVIASKMGNSVENLSMC